MGNRNFMQPIITAKNISKKYNITHQQGGYVALRDVMANVAKKPFAFLKHKAKKAIGKAGKEEFWALKDIDFEVQKGEAVGIIGANGAGKSTLLKILTGITPPTTGEITMRGKVASLLEVGTGFHPELTGRENLFLNGAILGMTKKEISDKFNDIVEFAGINKFIDTPVKRYSSGMYVRLAFSVAAHMEPDILLVDEVLAVGDAEFQKKCLGKMDEVTKKAGRTILFVSHNMSAIQNLCKRCILLKDGKIEMIGETHSITKHYLSSDHQNKKAEYELEEQTTPVSINKVTILNNEEILQSEIPISKKFKIAIEFICKENLNNMTVSTLFYSQDKDLLLYSSESDTTGQLCSFQKGHYCATIDIPAFLFNVGQYFFDIIIHNPNIAMFATARDILFEIINVDNPRSIIFQGKHSGKIASILSYQIKRK